jgi:hypothetical protein
MEQEYPYLRIGTAYYKIVQKPLASGDRMTLLLPWSVECIKQDHGKSYLSGIPKYDGFCFVPSHLHYKRFIGNFYNRYHPFIHVPKIGQPERTLAYLGHIFGDQLEYGLDYLKILLEIPMQMLPILCLVSTERNTGKTTFLKSYKDVFLFLNNDKAGQTAAEKLRQADINGIDASEFYKGYNDVNDYLSAQRRGALRAEARREAPEEKGLGLGR